MVAPLPIFWHVDKGNICLFVRVVYYKNMKNMRIFSQFFRVNLGRKQEQYKYTNGTNDTNGYEYIALVKFVY
ncbi:hypothetical protein CL630_00730 [bacterium]|nr:hypothetical protein [bacterium]|tara:strand:+ start:53898 stop:54113 length:216 start_codon:yes stop_codon:yes gene_type:complete